MRRRNFVVTFLILAVAFIANVQAQVRPKPVIHLADLVGKTSAEIDAILGKPKRVDVVSNARLPVTTEKAPDHFRSYKIANVFLGVWFYQDQPILFQASFRENTKIKVGFNNKIIPMTLEEGLSLIGIDTKNSKPNEVRIETNPTSPSLSARKRIKIWNREINGEKWERVETWENEHEFSRIGKGREFVTSIGGVWIVPPTR